MSSTETTAGSSTSNSSYSLQEYGTYSGGSYNLSTIAYSAASVTVEPVGEFELKGIRRPLAAYNVVSANALS